MERFASAEALRQHQSSLVEGVDPDKKIITICGGTGCTAFGSLSVTEAFEAELRARGVADTVSVKKTGCHGFCEKGPVVVILPSKVFYANVQVEDVERVVERTVLNDEIIEDLLYVDSATKQKIVYDHEIPFYAKQTRLVFRLNGILDPIGLDDYILHEGYLATAKAASPKGAR